jgi:hypothetical protein
MRSSFGERFDVVNIQLVKSCASLTFTPACHYDSLLSLTREWIHSSRPVVAPVRPLLLAILCLPSFFQIKLATLGATISAVPVDDSFLGYLAAAFDTHSPISIVSLHIPLLYRRGSTPLSVGDRG